MMVARSAWRTPGPPGISPSGLVGLGCSSPGVPDSTSAGLKPRPTSCPALPEMGSNGPAAGPFCALWLWAAGAAPVGELQAPGGEKLLPAPVAIIPLRGGCWEGGERDQSWQGSPSQSSRCPCLLAVCRSGGSEPVLRSTLALGRAHVLSEPLCLHFLALESGFKGVVCAKF